MFGIYLKYFFFLTKKVYQSYVTDTHYILLQVGSLKSALNRSTSGPTATTDEIKITRKRIDEMSSELTKLKKEVKL